MTQLALPLPTVRARRTDPDTSHAAAASAEALADDHFARILEALAVPSTIYELAARTRLSHVQIARRMPELEKLERVKRTELRRPGPTGRSCQVWERA